MITVRELSSKEIPQLVNYWFESPETHFQQMGADKSKLPAKEIFAAMLEQQLELPYEEKKAYALIAYCDEQAIGHCNLNPIVYGTDACMHLHIWEAAHRAKGYGSAMVKESLPHFFTKFDLQRLYCEPYALNPGPHKLLEHLGFIYEKTYDTIPGSINYLQSVKRWCMTREIATKL